MRLLKSFGVLLVSIVAGRLHEPPDAREVKGRGRPRADGLSPRQTPLDREADREILGATRRPWTASIDEAPEEPHNYSRRASRRANRNIG